MKSFIIFLLVSSLWSGEYSVITATGFYPDSVEKKMYLIDRFLPYNPKVVGLDGNAESKCTCMRHWPQGSFVAEDPFKPREGLEGDLTWVDSNGIEVYLLERAPNLLKSSKVVYTKTHYGPYSQWGQKLDQCLQSLGFALMIHWYKEDGEGEAIYVKKGLLEAFFRSLSYNPKASPPRRLSPPLDLERILRRVEDKSSPHQIDGIDFIYMINLDERPEKFALAVENLQQFGISPYRFSAVNGWKLDMATINQLGIRFPGVLEEEFLSTIYKEVDGRIYVSNTNLQDTDDAYFTLGLSPGAIGIVLSHLSVLQDAYNSGYETIWVMEDDAMALCDPNILSERIQELDSRVENWDLLFTDTDEKDKNGIPVPCRAMAARPNINLPPIDVFLQRFYPISHNLSRIGMRYGAYSMLVRRSGMKKILDYFRTYRLYLPYDFDFWMVPDIQIYSVNEDIVSNRVGAPSDNSYPGYIQQ
ncbi:MAG TPA: glycosyltransferase family 25 protein [Chlamydiales bacterium]|nr:glycosyltransferase family 25 protein [Chlamydiales bacterium]